MLHINSWAPPLSSLLSSKHFPYQISKTPSHHRHSAKMRSSCTNALWALLLTVLVPTAIAAPIEPTTVSLELGNSTVSEDGTTVTAEVASIKGSDSKANVTRLPSSYQVVVNTCEANCGFALQAEWSTTCKTVCLKYVDAYYLDYCRDTSYICEEYRGLGTKEGNERCDEKCRDLYEHDPFAVSQLVDEIVPPFAMEEVIRASASIAGSASTSSVSTPSRVVVSSTEITPTARSVEEETPEAEFIRPISTIYDTIPVGTVRPNPSTSTIWSKTAISTVFFVPPITLSSSSVPEETPRPDPTSKNLRVREETSSPDQVSSILPTSTIPEPTVDPEPINTIPSVPQETASFDMSGPGPIIDDMLTPGDTVDVDTVDVDTVDVDTFDVNAVDVDTFDVNAVSGNSICKSACAKSDDVELCNHNCEFSLAEFYLARCRDHTPSCQSNHTTPWLNHTASLANHTDPRSNLIARWSVLPFPRDISSECLEDCPVPTQMLAESVTRPGEIHHAPADPKDYSYPGGWIPDEMDYPGPSTKDPIPNWIPGEMDNPGPSTKDPISGWIPVPTPRSI